MQLTEAVYLKSLIFDQKQSREIGIDAIMNEHNLDAIITPNYAGAMIPAKAGYPSIIITTGYTEAGEPIDLTFTAGAYAESVLLECAYAFEQSTKYRRSPF